METVRHHCDEPFPTEPALWTLKTYFVGYISCHKPCSFMILHGSVRARGGKEGDSYDLKVTMPTGTRP